MIFFPSNGMVFVLVLDKESVDLKVLVCKYIKFRNRAFSLQSKEIIYNMMFFCIPDYFFRGGGAFENFFEYGSPPPQEIIS